ncbi:hypothetical protein SCP_1301760 [Sparassis crispa]|uniref:Uncharacterized protein n=1 Tax=Sparassis crispa TaxID=139825 RepID=A0A401H1Q4_9APHY|nr:hypothetical protein SCP_1301760 [Sparassis crispa]GBE88361.1 hypothetical protein SCP_1301760 [Sparassis crispa]
MQSFQSLDREMDTTLILLASPAHSSKLCDPALLNSSKLTAIRTSKFNHLASQRRIAHSQWISLFDQLHLSSPSIRGSPGSHLVTIPTDDWIFFYGWVTQ